jgi:regulator of cell morphogenesis and NO signaling
VGAAQRAEGGLAFGHATIGALARLRELTAGYTLPDWACDTVRALWRGLEELEADLHLHIHLENNILFPRAIAMESGG